LNPGRVLREPLLHFLLIGAALFLYYGHHAPGAGDNRRIAVSQQQVDDLAQQFQLTWSRPPTGTELRGLVDGYVHDEVLYREGIAAGLGREDAVIRRRVRQKLEVMAEEDSERAVPSDADLEAYLKAHPEKFMQPAIVTFEQLYFGAPDHGAAKQLDAAKAALATGKNADTLGRPTMLPRRVKAQDLDIVARDFGTGFAATLATLPLGTWSGPVASGLGAHLVRVEAWSPSSIPTLSNVRTAVQREWENDRRHRALDASYQKMRANYDVVLEAKLPPAP
jgi:hypothetical protein